MEELRGATSNLWYSPIATSDVCRSLKRWGGNASESFDQRMCFRQGCGIVDGGLGVEPSAARGK